MLSNSSPFIDHLVILALFLVVTIITGVIIIILIIRK